MVDWYDKQGNLMDSGSMQAEFLLRDAQYRHVARTKIMYDSGAYDVSTVWLGLDHGWGGGTTLPIIFETMVFEWGQLGELDVARYSTLEAAQAGHDRMVKDWTGKIPGAQAETLGWESRVVLPSVTNAEGKTFDLDDII